MRFDDLDLSKTYTYADYLTWTFTERLELIKGKIFRKGPAPGSQHQLLVAHIGSELFQFLKKKDCKVFLAPFDVRLPRKTIDDKEIITVLQPDVCVICDLNKVDKKGCLGAPDIVVEILSPGNNQKELQNKFEVYEESGVREYWIVHPEEKTFLQYVRTDGRFMATRLKTSGDVITTDILPGFSLSLEEVFQY